MPKVLLPHAPNARTSGARPGRRRPGTVKRDKQVLIRLTAEEFATLQVAADAADSALANWARMVLLAAARQTVVANPPMGPMTIYRSRRDDVLQEVDHTE